ncbi:hypothetical protein AB0H00_06050 [Nocardia sp. NPDC023852]|uniref:hypothetical protein n=1 Tax=Nocardia sp. NPDC023852 TaxID=3154697 RepID=UPI0033ED5401
MTDSNRFATVITQRVHGVIASGTAASPKPENRPARTSFPVVGPDVTGTLICTDFTYEVAYENLQ